MKIKHLSKYEQDVLLPRIIKDFRTKYSRFHPITASMYCMLMNAEGFHIQDVTFRKIIKYIQVNGLLKYIVADSCGFYRTTSKSIIKRQIDSLISRENEIRAVREELQRQISVK